MASYRIVLADDHILFREGIKKIIEDIPGIEFAGEVGDGLELMELLNDSIPDLIILDLTMPKLPGLEVAKRVKKLHPRVKILVLTMHKSKEHLYRTLSAGADGFLLKENAYGDLISAIETIRKGEVYVSKLVQGHMVDFFREPSRGSVQSSESLSAREREILGLISEGKTSKEIAAQLGISVSTVNCHRVKIKKKLQIKKTADLIRYSIQRDNI